MSRKPSSFRVGRVQAYLRGQVWYLCYHEHGRRMRPRAGSNCKAARQLAAQINAQLEVGAPAALSFETIAIPALREQWLQHHEQVLRSSVQTIDRYRTATEHLLRFLVQRPVRCAAQFHAKHAEEFVCFLRTIKVSPNGHANTAKRSLMDKGLRYVLECCRALFNYAAKRRHLSPYAENPFHMLEIDRIPVEEARPITLFTPDRERAFFEACDDWQFPLFLTLTLTGLRPGELTHLLLPEDLDLDSGLLRVRNKPKLGWQVKTRNERDVPLVPVLVQVLRAYLQVRKHGPAFRRRRWSARIGESSDLSNKASDELEFAKRVSDSLAKTGQAMSRRDHRCLARRFWLEMGAVREDRVRLEFMGLTKAIGLPTCTAPKMFRHQFATALQEGRVDPLIRNELMGHVAPGERSAGHGLAMTAVYTHTRPQTRREQLEAALASHPAIAVAQAWIQTQRDGPT